MRIVVLWQNDHFGRELLRVWKRSWQSARYIMVDIAYDVATNISTRTSRSFKRAGAEFVFSGVPSKAAKVMRLAADAQMAPGLHRRTRRLASIGAGMGRQAWKTRFA